MDKYIEIIQTLSINNKYANWYISLIERSLNRKLENIYFEKHHILPKCFNMGGEKDPLNICKLTAKEHFICHLCLAKMFSGEFKNKMIYAFRGMVRSNKYQTERINSNTYTLLKVNKKEYKRIYNKEKIKYIYKNNTQELQKYLDNGWSLQMTDEYKIGRVGNMKGKKHKESTKKKMRDAQKNVDKSHLIGRKVSQESIQKQKETRLKNIKNDPEKYQKSLKQKSETLKKLYKEGRLNVAGKNNPMYRKRQTAETKEKISKILKKSYQNKLQNNPEKIQEFKKLRSIKSKQYWSDPENHKKAKIFNSKSFKKYGISPLSFYEKYIKPLLYLGLNPKSMAKYKLIQLHESSIKNQIKTYGSEEDKKLLLKIYENGKGANLKYRTFLKEQCEKILNGKIKYELPKPIN